MNSNYAFPVYGCFILLSYLIGQLTVFIYLRKMAVDRFIIGTSIALNIILSILGAMLLPLIETGFKRLGFASMGGLLGLMLGVAIVSYLDKEDGMSLIRANTVALPLMYSVSKLACYFTGCCAGVNGFPIQLCEVIVFGGIFVISLFLVIIRKQEHSVLIVLIICAAAKFSLDYFRESHVGLSGLSTNQWLCAVLVVGIVLVMIFKSLRNNVKN